MPALTISAVDSTTDQLTITAHGLATGAGAAAVYTPNGAIPGGLAAVTDYWVIVVDANHVKLASSSANALAGTAIDITSNGSGTLQLLLGLPYRRATTYTAGSQVKSADLDTLQDDQVALWNLLTGQPQAIFGDIALPVNLALAANKNLKLQGTGYVQRGTGRRLYPFLPGSPWQIVTGAPPAYPASPPSSYVQVPASTTAYYSLRIESDKDRIQAVVVYGRAFVGAATLSLYLTSGMNSGTESVNVLTLSGGGTTLSVPADSLYNPRTLTLQTPVQPTAGEVLMLRVDTTTGNTLGLLSYGVDADVP